MNKLFLLLALFSVNVLAVPVNVNTADAKTIAKSLDGIGMSKAKAIVQYREDNGEFKNQNELSKVKGIGKKTIAKNKKDILIKN